jgi:hypothetical protein
MAIFGSNTNMPTYVNVSGTWQELTGTDRPFANVSGTWQGATNMYANVSGTWQQVYQFDNTGPVIAIPTVVSGGSADTVTWAAVTDAGSGVASATLNQYFHNVTANTYIAGNTYSIPSPTTSGSTSMAISNTYRNSPSGDHYQVYYYLTATDNAGNSSDGSAPGVGLFSAFTNTKPLGTFNFFPSGTPVADSRNLANTAWLGTTAEGIVGLSSTTRAYGCWFYGTNTIYNKCKLWQADSGTIFVKRAAGPTPGPADPNRGNSGSWTLQGHNLGSASGAATFSGTGVSTGAMNTDSVTATVSLNSSILAGFADGSMQGIGGSAHTNQPAFLLGNRDFSGWIQLIYT